MGTTDGHTDGHTVRSADGTAIGFAKLGNGPPLVLVHGSTDTGEGWLAVASALADRMTCYLVDRRGRGRSDDGPEYAIAREAEDVEAVLGVAGPGAHLLGHSYGAICALEAARRAPIGRLVLYEPPLALPRDMLRDVSRRVADTLEAGSVDEALALFLQGGPGLAETEVAALRETPIWKRMVEVAPTLPRELHAILGLDGDLGRYRDVQADALLLVGTESRPELVDGSRRLQDVLPNARTQRLEGQAHVANMLVPQTVSRVVAEFLVGDAGGGSGA